ncbi:MAG: phage tail protein [Ignavibacteria bacterium]|nr:phage tail protein [Ignavibacteria bacterium]
MLRNISVILFLITISTSAQDITNTLGVDGTFKVKNSASTDLVQVTSSGSATINGATTINGDLNLNGKITVTNGANTYSLPTFVAGAGKVISSNADGTSSWVDNKKLSVMFIICVTGEQFPSSEDPITGPFIGEIKMVAGTTASYKIPQNFMSCSGQLLQIIAPYQALYALIVNKYGGDASNGTFALPDFRNTMPISNP